MTIDFNLGIYSYEDSFGAEDQIYELDGSERTFEVSPLVLTPSPSEALEFTYSAKLANGEELDKDLMIFDSEKLEIVLKSGDSKFEGDYEVVLEAQSTDERWLG